MSSSPLQVWSQMSGAVFMHRLLGCLKLLVLPESKPVLAIFISFIASLSKSRESK